MKLFYPFPNFNGCTLELWEGISHFIHPTLHNGRDYLYMLGLKLTHVSKSLPGTRTSAAFILTELSRIKPGHINNFMMTSSNGNIFGVTGLLCREFTGPGDFPTQGPVTRSFDVFFDVCLNKRLSKLPWGWWFETPSWSLWRHCNVSRGNPTHS